MIVGTYEEMAAYLTSGYWNSTGSTQRSFLDNNVSYNITGLQDADKEMARQALHLWEDVSSLVFTETSGNADIVFDDENSGAYASLLSIGNELISSSINISPQWGGGVGASIYSYRFSTFIHEIGHAIGLGHQGPYDGSASYPADAAYDNDSWQVSAMSYFHQVQNTSVDGTFTYYLTPQIVDIIAVQSLYGPNLARVGDTTYGVGNNTGRESYGADFEEYAFPTVTIYDRGGVDTLNYSGTNLNQTIRLGSEEFSSVYGEINNIVIARETVIENAVGGAGDDSISGNSADNALSGNAGNDFLQGLEGNDTLRGDEGADTLSGGSGTNTADYSTSPGAVYVAGGYGAIHDGYSDWDTVNDVQKVIGSAFDDAMVAGPSSSEFHGGSGNDVLVGSLGDDTLFGGENSDHILGGTGEDVIEGGDGVDAISGNSAFGEQHDGVTDTFVYSQVPSSIPDVDLIDFDPKAPALGGDVLDVSGLFATIPGASILAVSDGQGNSLIGILDGSSVIQLWAWVVGVADPADITDDNILT